ncbi:hypothetical protein Tco_0158983, partial [Tanacetum coccineum]
IIEQKVKVDQKVRILELKRRNYEEQCSDILYAVSIKEDMAYLCPKLHSTSTKRRFYTPYPEDIHTPYSSISRMVISEQVGLARDLGSTNDVMIPWVKIWTEVDDLIADVILDDLLQRTFNEPKLVKGKRKRTLNDDKGKLTRLNYVDDLKKRIQNVEAILYKAKEQMMKQKVSQLRFASQLSMQTEEEEPNPLDVPMQTEEEDPIPLDLQKQKLDVLAERETLKFLAEDKSFGCSVRLGLKLHLELRNCTSSLRANV